MNNIQSIKALVEEAFETYEETENYEEILAALVRDVNATKVVEQIALSGKDDDLTYFAQVAVVQNQWTMDDVLDDVYQAGIRIENEDMIEPLYKHQNLSEWTKEELEEHFSKELAFYGLI
jgi:hypothetical protein